MSSNSQRYTLVVDIDDSKLRQKLGMGATTGSGSGGGSGGMGGSKALADLGKLGAIATATAGTVIGLDKIFNQLVKSSPILETMLKVLNTGFMFMVRPIADFIGMILRPISIFMLRLGISIYKEWGPVLRQLGTWIGGGLLSAITGITAPMEEKRERIQQEQLNATQRNVQIGMDIKEALHNFVSNPGAFFAGLSLNLPDIEPLAIALEEWWAEPSERMQTAWGSFVTNTLNNVNNIGSSFSTMFTSIGETVLSLRNSWIQSVAGIVGIFNGLSSRMTEFYTTSILPSLDIITTFFVDTFGTLQTVFEDTWNSIVGFFSQIQEWFNGLFGRIGDLISSTVGGAGVQAAQGAVGGIGDVAINLYDTVIEGAEGISDFGETLSNQLNNALNGNR